MTALRVTSFGGIIPRLGDRNLPDNNAQYALNAKLFSGELRAWWEPLLLSTISTPANPVDFYFFEYLGGEQFLGFTEKTDVVRAALINDAYKRLYWTNSSGAFITTMADVVAPIAPAKLGVPTPAFGTFTVAAVGGTPALAETRVYTAILVSKYGEEGSNGPTFLVNGNADGTWTVTGLNTVTYDVSYINMEKVRLYRTITSSTGVDYRQVNEWLLTLPPPASYVDNVSATTLASAPALQSLTWTPPPAGLQGLTGVAGGFMVGFVGRTVYFSEPYFPHAWPEEYQKAVEDDIVAIGTYGNTVVVTTKGQPQIAIGTVPAAMSFTKIETNLPCISNRSLVSTVGAVLYASTDGLVSVSDGGINIVSKPFVTKDEWLSQFATPTMRSGIYSDRYLSFYSNTLGFCIGFDDPSTAFTELQYPPQVIAVHNDKFTGRTMFLSTSGKVYEWDGTFGTSQTYTWRTKPFMTPKPVNFGAGQIRGSFLTAPAPDAPALPVTPSEHATNDDVINSMAINGRIAGPVVPDAVGAVSFKYYADNVLVYSRLVTGEDAFRLPSGFKAVRHEFEISGTTPIYSVTVAETMKSLEKVP